jgi:tRNA(Ile)-lysidine synthase TilS/MesJ
MIEISNDRDVEWYMGKDAYTHPRRVKVNGIWRDVFDFKKKVIEEYATRRRLIAYECNIGDNEIVRVKILGG